MSTSNIVKDKLCYLISEGEDITDFVKKYKISKKTIDTCKKQVMDIQNNIENKESNFQKDCWNIITKSNELILDRLSKMAQREKEIDEIISKIEEFININGDDGKQLSKIIKNLEILTKQMASISELSRIIQIYYGKQKDDGSNTNEYENIIENLYGEEF